MEVTDRAAYESLRRKYDYLATALQPADILPSLFASGLISIMQMQEIELAIHERGPAQGCSKLLGILMSNGSEGAFQKFLGVLRNESHLKYLVPGLQSEFNFTFNSSSVMLIRILRTVLNLYILLCMQPFRFTSLRYAYTPLGCCITD